MKIIDFEKKGNVVRFYLGKDDDEGYGGDDWNDVPYEHNAGKVYSEHVVGHRDIVFPFEFVVLEPKNPEWRCNSRWCKDDMKTRKVPCIIAVGDPDWCDDDFDYYLDDERAIRFYFGDKMEPAESITIFKEQDSDTE